MPFARYKDFDDCVKKTMSSKKWNRERSSAYCAVIMRKVEQPKVESKANEMSEVTIIDEESIKTENLPLDCDRED